jgi:CRP-like cAMP-binding protein
MVEFISKVSPSLLKEIKLLQAFSDSELAQIVALGTTSTYEAHANIVIEGELSWGMYVILGGMVGIYKNNKLNGTQFDVGQLRSGSFFGEMSLIDDNPRSATVRALTDTQLFYVSKDAFMGFLSRSSDLQVRFYTSCIGNLVKRLRDLNDDYVISQFQLWQVALTKEGESR